MNIKASLRLFAFALMVGGATSAFAVDIKIVGGITATNHAYPFIAGIEERTFGFRFCGGTLISRTKVLTAAHCITDASSGAVDMTPLQIRIGTNNKLTSPGRVYQVTRGVRHPRYNNISFDFDVAILTLGTPVQLSDAANIVALPQACASMTCITGLVKPGTLLRVAGWGATNTAGDIFPDAMRQVDIPVVSNAMCDAAWGGFGDITRRMMCAGFVQGGKDSCGGDSGGPLFAYLPAARSAVQAGIVSFGLDEGCASPNLYGVYTRISEPSIRSFIFTQAGV